MTSKNLVYKKLFIPSLKYYSRADFIEEGYRYPIDSDIRKMLVNVDPIYILGLQDVAVVGRGFTMIESAWKPIFNYEDLHFFPRYVSTFFNSGKCSPHTNILSRKLKPVKVDVVATVIHYNWVYGHFLLEILPRLFVLKEFFKLSASPPPIALPIDLRDWLKNYILEIWGNWDVIWFNPNEEYISADETFVVTSSHLYYSPEMARLYISFAEQYNFELPQKILIARPDKHCSNRTLTNFDELKAIAVDRGYRVVEPTSLGSLQKQANLFNKCSIILGEFNSALINTLFSPLGTYIGCLNYLQTVHNHIAAVQGHNLNYLIPEEGPTGPWIAGYESKSYLICEKKFSKLIDDIEYTYDKSQLI